MASWLEIGRNSEAAARLLMGAGMYRSSASRAYYSSYALITHRVAAPAKRFVYDRQNPSHGQILVILERIGKSEGWSRAKLSDCRRQFRILYEGRIDADYRPGRTVDKVQAMAMLLSMNRLRNLLENS